MSISRLHSIIEICASGMLIEVSIYQAYFILKQEPSFHGSNVNEYKLYIIIMLVYL